LALAHDYNPSSILLDIHLPDIQGWRVMERLQHDLTTRHIPVCIISTDDSRDQAVASGALAFVAKPIQKREVLDNLLDTITNFSNRNKKTILVVEPDAKRRSRIIKTIDADGMEIVQAKEEKIALQMLSKQQIDCLILSPKLFGIINKLAPSTDDAEMVLGSIPVIVYGEAEINEGEWKRLSKVYPLRKALSPDRLLDLVASSLHRNISTLPEAWQKKLGDMYHSDKPLAGKKVLIVDDDTRNIFALTSVLEEHHMVILSADNGRDAINILQKESDIDIVLMDIMMPEMDGMETIREIRKFAHLKDLPIVAVTAKAMKGDREKCIEAGAWDYLSKPVNTEQMMAVLRAWLQR